MDILQPLFDIFMFVLEIMINDAYFAGIAWTIIIVMVVLLLIYVYKEAFKVRWKR